jgi:hypothetical protein
MDELYRLPLIDVQIFVKVLIVLMLISFFNLAPDNSACLRLQHSTYVVPIPEVPWSITYGAHTDSMILSGVIWTLLSPLN